MNLISHIPQMVYKHFYNFIEVLLTYGKLKIWSVQFDEFWHIYTPEKASVQSIKAPNISTSSPNFFKPGLIHLSIHSHCQVTTIGEIALCQILYEWNYIIYFLLSLTSLRIMMLRFIQIIVYITDHCVVLFIAE